ncbi:phage shock protein operon transcriptional activator [Desulfobacter postgatei]|uniref:phage shock protein operon transcriptional activator n=1 Tax=Desulfobacter postgatei TaxID=2293 RepID=UPI002A35E11A|nr:phage shock protein operon transcriptional activator [Desulfobacter postgatei]MDX9963730.1 phage shock protein operon transcriptional activator [Desulfobacter postgatei]
MRLAYTDSMDNNTAPVSMSEALGQSEAFLNFQDQISRVAPIDRPVLILGERGTGKELASARLHFLSRRWQKPFVTLNCAALTATLIESELFGYEKGAFTGAGTRRIGRFEQADGGTLFLDEIGNIPMEVQEKILRVVEYGRFERVGAVNPVHTDVRIVGAANVDLAQMVRAGLFKQDLLDRLSFEVIYVPPLRVRNGDVMLLAKHFAGRMAFELGFDQVLEFGKKAAHDLEAHGWPGNVRELKNVVERAVYKTNGPVITRIDFSPFSSPFDPLPGPGTSSIKQVENRTAALSADGKSIRDTEKRLGTHEEAVLTLAELSGLPLKKAVFALERFRLSQALTAARFNQKEAAANLGISYDQLRGLKKKHGM